MCMLMTFSTIERTSTKQPSAELHCTNNGGSLALRNLTGPQVSPLDQVPVFANPGNRCRIPVILFGTCPRMFSATSDVHLDRWRAELHSTADCWTVVMNSNPTMAASRSDLTLKLFNKIPIPSIGMASVLQPKVPSTSGACSCPSSVA